MRKNLQIEIRRIQKELNITTIFVTHDQDEAMLMSDRVCLLNEGKIVGFDTHDHLLETCSVYQEIYDSQIRNEVSA